MFCQGQNAVPRAYLQTSAGARALLKGGRGREGAGDDAVGVHMAAGLKQRQQSFPA